MTLRSQPQTFILGPLLLLALLPALSLAAPATQPASTSGANPAEPPHIHWIAYSDDLFARAQREHRLVLLDLEAVWCHWCHVEDEITYRDPKVISLINDHYLAVKVDQDSRPDLANRYEKYGWPATILFDSTGRELVKRSGYIPPGPMVRLLQAVIDDPTPGPSAQPQDPIAFDGGSALAPSLRQELASTLHTAYDATEGGWGTVHKFVYWDAVEYSFVRGDPPSLARARQTLDQGLLLIDPAWGGVYQYSTDGDWKHPHFEKLLQFQAADLRLYTIAGSRLKEVRYAAAADALRKYMLAFLRSPDGAFYVSQDADLVAGEHSASYFALNDAGRRKLGVPRVDQHLYARENGWAIAAFSSLYEQSQDSSDLDAARKAAGWIIAHRSLDGGGFRHDEADPAGPYLGDTLQMGQAFLSLYEATADRDWLTRAQAAASFIQSHFQSATTPGFLTSAGRSALASAPQADENVDAARFFNLLWHYGGRDADHAAALAAMKFISTSQIAKDRGLFVAGILLADRELSTVPTHLTIVGPKSDSAARALYAAAQKSAPLYRRIEWSDPAEGPLPNADVTFPKLKKPAAFVCTANSCSPPIADPAALQSRLEAYSR